MRTPVPAGSTARDSAGNFDGVAIAAQRDGFSRPCLIAWF